MPRTYVQTIMGDKIEDLNTAAWAPYRCPKCRRCDSIPMPRIKWFDIAVQAVGLAPYKCRACRHKYYRRSMKPGDLEEQDEVVLDWAAFVRNPRQVHTGEASQSAAEAPAAAPHPAVSPSAAAPNRATVVFPAIRDRSETKQRLDQLIRSAEDRKTRRQ